MELEALKVKYQEVKPADVIKENDSTSLAEVKKEIEDIYSWLDQYTQAEDYRNQLPDENRRLIEEQFVNAINQFEAITRLRNDDLQGLISQKPGLIDAVKAYYKMLYGYFYQDYRSYRIDNQGADYINKLENVLKTAEQSEKTISKKEVQIEEQAKAASVATAEIGLSELAKYYYQLVKGDNDWMILKKSKNKYLNFWYKFKYRIWYKFVLQHLRGYEGAARIWLFLSVVAFIVTFLIAIYTLSPFLHALTDQTQTSATLIDKSGGFIFAVLAAKALVLIAPIYAIRFCLKNYGSNKHLAADSLHKAKALQTLSTYLAIVHDDKDAVREISTVVAKAVFTPADSGFVTKKDDYENTAISVTPPFNLSK